MRVAWSLSCSCSPPGGAFLRILVSSRDNSRRSDSFSGDGAIWSMNRRTSVQRRSTTANLSYRFCSCAAQRPQGGSKCRSVICRCLCTRAHVFSRRGCARCQGLPVGCSCVCLATSPELLVLYPNTRYHQPRRAWQRCSLRTSRKSTTQNAKPRSGCTGITYTQGTVTAAAATRRTHALPLRKP